MRPGYRFQPRFGDVLPASPHLISSRQLMKRPNRTGNQCSPKRQVALVNLLVMQVHGEQGAVHCYFAFVANESNESPLPEPVHKNINSAARGANHSCQNLLTDPGNASAFRTRLAQLQKHTCEPLLG